jgi:hypothetical protein
MRPSRGAWLVLVLIAVVGAVAGAVAQQRIFGTDTNGNAVPIQVAADGSVKFALAITSFEFEGATDDAFETSLAVVDPTADRTITFQDASGTVVTYGSAGVRISDDGDGAITLLGLGDGSDEDLTLNLDDTSNVGTFTSSTSLATLNFSSIALQESGVGVANLDELDASSELAAIIDDESGTGLIVFGTGPNLSRTVEANTGAKSPSAAETWELYTNTGDGDGSTIALVNDPAAGLVYTVAVTAAQTITITPAAGETLRLAADACAVSLTSNTVGSVVTIESVVGGAGGVWQAHSATGTWVCND